MSYLRVIPRDLFNEAKLLKCLGQLALIVLDEVGAPAGIVLRHDDATDPGFVIEQDSSDGALYCSNFSCEYRGRMIGLQSPYNCKDAFPLRFILDGEEGGSVLDDTGRLSEEFLKLLRKIQKTK